MKVCVSLPLEDPLNFCVCPRFKVIFVVRVTFIFVPRVCREDQFAHPSLHKDSSENQGGNPSFNSLPSISHCDFGFKNTLKFQELDAFGFNSH